MTRSLVVDVTRDLPPRQRPLSDEAVQQVFGGGCVPMGSPCKTARDCCPVYVAPGDYILCYFYRGHGDFVSGYCTKASVEY